MNKVAIRRLGLWSVFKFSIVAYLILFLLGFIMLLVAYLITMIAGSTVASSDQTNQALQQLGLSGGVFLLVAFFGGILMSVFYAACNWFGAVLYNLLAMMTGGIEMSIEDVEAGQAGLPS